MEQLRYIIEDSTIAEILGVQNFSTKEAAVLELVKNAYDAHALNLRIAISDAEIIISDDGAGMNREILDSYWMRIGKTSKDYIENGRVMAGSKGIGRFAMARLGKHVVVDSYRVGDSAIRWITDWNASNVETVLTNTRKGTTIRISELRDRWAKREISQLVEYLSRSYADDQMRIEIEFDDAVYIVPNYFEELDAGKDYVWKIEMNYHSAAQQLEYTFEGDEFLESAQQLCSDNISWFSGTISIADEFSTRAIAGESENIVKDLGILGDFGAVFYFQNKPLKSDIEKFMYKQHSGLTRKISGIALYRNAFSIAGYEGKRDWLELGKRSRKSPAAASHPTGAWRVRENQLFGKVDIDKRANCVLSDLSNRQGLEENTFYKLFIDILTTGIACFERYRQALIRSIDKKKNKKEKNRDSTPFIDQFLREPVFKRTR